MNQQFEDVVRYWIPELIVFAIVGAVTGVTLGLLGVDKLPALVIGVCVLMIFHRSITASVRKVMAPKPEKTDT